MAGCDLAASCWFYQELMPDLPATSRYIKSHFCLGDYAQCVRYQVHKEVGATPQRTPERDLPPAARPPLAEFARLSDSH